MPFERVLFAVGIRFVGETVAKILARAFKSMDNLKKATVEELTQVNEIGDRIAQSIVSFFADEKNCALVQRLSDIGLKMEIEDSATDGGSDRLAGKTVVISGVFNHHSRDEYKQLIEKHGGKNTGSISAKTSFILAGQNMGPSKLEKARELGVPLMSENEFLVLIDEKPTITDEPLLLF